MQKTLICFTLIALALTACGTANGADELQGTLVAIAIQQTALAQASEEAEVTEDPTATPTELADATATATLEPSATSTNPPPDPTDTPEPTATPYQVPDWPIVRINDSGALVRAVQHLLRSHGYNLTVDGEFGAQTRGRVMAFQGDKGLSVDGIVGPQTWAALIQGKQIKEGSNGQAVRALQVLLSDYFFYNNVTVDGDFGPITDAAVRDFQAAYDLDVDGIVGPETWKALISIDPLD